MGDKWIKGNLADAVGVQKALEIRSAMSQNEVGTYLFNIQKNGHVDLIKLVDGNR